jgi:hypothetical protein
LNGSIAAARSQLNKAEEHLAACHRFQEFLDSITPGEHFEAARAEQERNRAAAEAAWVAECEAVRQAKVAAAKAKEQAEVDYDNARTQQVWGHVDCYASYCSILPNPAASAERDTLCRRTACQHFMPASIG